MKPLFKAKPLGSAHFIVTGHIVKKYCGRLPNYGKEISAEVPFENGDRLVWFRRAQYSDEKGYVMFVEEEV